MAKSQLPKDFLWGAATSSYQIEGAVKEGGRLPSIWDKFCYEPGRIEDGTNGDEACDHYHRWEADLDLMKSLNLKAYRFSIAWPRVMPKGTGAINPDGVKFYNNLIDGLLKRGIEPWVTLYHWDLPLALDEHGGWLNREVVDQFTAYAREMVKLFGDRVKHWITHNEPWCVSHLGYRTGEHAPGLKDSRKAYIAAHHVLMSHGKAVPAMREVHKDLHIGITLNLCPAYPASGSTIDAEATKKFDGEFNRWYLDPVFKGQYPEDMLPFASKDCGPQGMDFVKPGDTAMMNVATDFFGINYYSRAVIRGDEHAPGQLPRTLSQSEEVTDMGWEISPKGLEDVLVRVQNDYHPQKIYVTENGCAYADGPDAKGSIADQRRLTYLADHFKAAENAIARGAKLAGFFVWSLFDNFEWAFGYKKRFGIVWVDYETQERIPKSSALWYANVIKNHDITPPRD